MTQAQQYRKLRRWVKAQHIKLYGTKCLFCKGIFKFKDLQVDHIKSRYLYPELVMEPSNLQVLCAKCNSVKSYRTRDYRPTEYPTKNIV